MSSFSEGLRDYLAQLNDLRQRGASEDSIRDALLRFLRDAFPRLEEAEPILLERHVPALRVRGGFADALYGDLIFECKRRLDDRSRAEGQDELSRYVRNQKHSERYLGILTDGETLEVYALRDGQLAKVDQLRLVTDRADEAKLWLDCYLFHEKHLTPTANDVALRFGERSPSFWHSLRILEDLWRRAGTEPAAQTKFLEWQSLLSIVYGSAVGDEALFLRHTYLAVFSRALAFVALRRCTPTAEQLAGTITGETFKRMGFENFMGDDFFTWMTQPDLFEQARGVLHALATRLTAAYDLDAVHEDLLKELYQELVDPETRHDLGEFYTPDWLAELTLRQAGFPAESPGESLPPSLFDPACGSGTFLFTAVRLLREAGRRGGALVHFCAEHLAGIDVHPLAVTIAKTNLLLALGDDLRKYRKHFVLPVYMADSLSSVDSVTSHPEIEIPVAVDEIAARCGKARARGLPAAFGVPGAMADEPGVLHAALDALLEFGNPQVDAAAAGEGFQRRLAELGIPDRQHHQWHANLDLMRWLLEPPATDSVWRFILKNACQPELLARRKFTFVVGNPPWLSYRYIKRRDYQDRVRKLIFEYGLLDKKHAHLFTQMELATLFFALCAGRYLAEGGILAFVMPRSVLTGAKQHAEFRSRYVAAATVLIDCQQVTPLFNVPACVVVARKSDLARSQPSAGAQEPIAMLRLQGELPRRNAPLAEAALHWKASKTTYTAIAPQSGSPYWAEVTQGASIAPRCVWFVCPPEIARVIDQRRPHLETDQSTERQAKAPWKGIRLSGSVEADYLFATLLSANMLPFGWRQLSLLVLPLAFDKRTGARLVDSDAAVRLGKAGLSAWLRKADDAWLEHRKSTAELLEWLNWQKKLTRQSPTGVVKLLYGGSGTHLCASVVDATHVKAWRVHNLAVRGFIADTKTYWLEARSPYEAHYLCAVLNAPVVDEAIKPYQTKGAFGAQRGGGERDIHRRPFEVLPIPRFEKSDRRHRKLAELSRGCHEKVRQAVADAAERWLTVPIGRLRTQLRTQLLQDELAQINEIAREILERP